MSKEEIEKNEKPKISKWFGMALATNFSAISHFSRLPVEERNLVIEKSSEFHSDVDMKKYVDSHFGKNTIS